MLPVNCPGCGASFRIPPDRLATQMHCRRCETDFYFDGGGSLITGKKPVTKKEDDDAARYKAMSKSAAFRLGPSWSHLPLPVRGGLAAAALVGLAAVVGIWANRARLNVPETLTERVEYAAKAILNNDDTRLQAVCAPNSYKEAAELAAGVRELLEKKGIGADSTIMVQEQSNDKDRVSNLSARFMPASLDGVVQKAEAATGSRGSGKDRAPSKAAINAVAARTYELHLVWVKDDSGAWLLDGAQSMQYYAKDSSKAKARSTASRSPDRDGKGN